MMLYQNHVIADMSYQAIASHEKLLPYIWKLKHFETIFTKEQQLQKPVLQKYDSNYSRTGL